MNIRYPIYEGVYRILTEKGMGSGTIVSFFIPLDFNYAF